MLVIFSAIMYSFYPFTYFTSYGIIRLDNHIRKRGAAVLTYQDIRKVKGRIEKYWPASETRVKKDVTKPLYL